MSTGPTVPSGGRKWLRRSSRLGGRLAAGARGRLEATLGGPERTRVIVVLAAVAGLASADVATVGASAIQLRSSLHIDNTDIGLLVALSSVVGAVASVPFGVLADRVRRTAVLSASVVLWGGAMLWSATATSFGQLLLARLALGIVMAAAGPLTASLVGDYFPDIERGRIFTSIGVGELAGGGIGFAVTGDLAALSWRVAFAALALPALFLAWYVVRLPEPTRGTTLFTAYGAAPPQRVGAPAPTASSSPTKEVTDAQQLAIERQIRPDPRFSGTDPGRMGLLAATRYVLRVRTNVFLILSGAAAYYFLAGVQTFGVEFAKGQYHVNQALANLLMLVVGGGAGVGVLVGGPLGDLLLRRGRLHGRVLVAALAAGMTPLFFIPALISSSALTALPYIVFAAAALSAQNPPIDAARLDIMPAALWGRAEGVRTLIRSAAQALAPLLFGAVSDIFGGEHAGLRWAFVVMLVPLGASAYFLFRAVRTVAVDVATAASLSARGHRTGGRVSAPPEP
jgi:MFS family permease